MQYSSKFFNYSPLTMYLLACHSIFVLFFVHNRKCHVIQKYIMVVVTICSYRNAFKNCCNKYNKCLDTNPIPTLLFSIYSLFDTSFIHRLFIHIFVHFWAINSILLYLLKVKISTIINTYYTFCTTKSFLLYIHFNKYIAVQKMLFF